MIEWSEVYENYPYFQLRTKLIGMRSTKALKGASGSHFTTHFWSWSMIAVEG